MSISLGPGLRTPCPLLRTLFSNITLHLSITDCVCTSQTLSQTLPNNCIYIKSPTTNARLLGLRKHNDPSPHPPEPSDIEYLHIFAYTYKALVIINRGDFLAVHCLPFGYSPSSPTQSIRGNLDEIEVGTVIKRIEYPYVHQRYTQMYNPVSLFVSTFHASETTPQQARTIVTQHCPTHR